MEQILIIIFFLTCIIAVLGVFFCKKKILQLSQKIDTLLVGINQLKNAPIKNAETVSVDATEFDNAMKPDGSTQPDGATKSDVAKNDVAKSEVFPINAQKNLPISENNIPDSDDESEYFFIHQLEKYFAINISGIVGIAAITAGVIFLFVSAAIALNAIGRFLLTCTSALIIYVVNYFYIDKKEWRRVSTCLESVSGIILLTGCVASASVPSMKFCSNGLASSFVIFSIFINMAIGLKSKAQASACIHTAFGLVAMSMIPFAYASFVIASTIASVGLFMALNEHRWNMYLILTTLLYTLIHFFWTRSFAFAPIPSLVTCIIVGMISLAIHYQISYETPPNDAKALTARVILWICFGVNLSLHLINPGINIILLLTGTGITYAISAYALKNNTTWLHICDKIVSFILLMMACFCLSAYGVEIPEIMLLAISVGTIFLYFLSWAQEKYIFRIINLFILVGYALLATYNLKECFIAEHQVSLRFIYAFALHSVMLYALYPLLEKNAIDKQISFCIGKQFLTFFVLPLCLISVIWVYVAFCLMPYCLILSLVAISLCCYVVILRHRADDYITNCLSILAISAGGFIWIYKIYNYAQTPPLYNIRVLLFALMIAACDLYFSIRKENKRLWLNSEKNPLSNALNDDRIRTLPSLLLLWLTLIISIYSYIKDINPVGIGIGWLFTSLLICMMRNYVRQMASKTPDFQKELPPKPKIFRDSGVVQPEIIQKLGFSGNSEKEAQTTAGAGSSREAAMHSSDASAQTADPTTLIPEKAICELLLYIGLAGILLSLIRFFVWDISDNFIAFAEIKLRILAELFLLGVIAYWISSENQNNGKQANWLLEMLLILGIICAIREVSLTYQILIWPLVAFGCYFSVLRTPYIHRIRLYSYFFYFLSLIHMVFITCFYGRELFSTLGSKFLIMNVVATSILAGFVMFTLEKQQKFEGILIPVSMKLLLKSHRIIIKYYVEALLYPLLIAIALFIYNGFSHVLLSFLWLVECFALFIIGIRLRNPGFKNISIIFTGLLCLRVILYDLYSQDFLTKALVFLGIGLILITVNIIRRPKIAAK
ncbi:MAG: hypothetical protein LBB12_00440 [Holosporaceae bacterium]|nr:hypothetical protein [Holosporaceae bacterium]